MIANNSENDCNNNESDHKNSFNYHTLPDIISCPGANQHQGCGELKDLKAGTTIYLSSFLFPVKKDSVVAGKGRFEFNLALDEGDYYKLRIGKYSPALFILSLEW